MDCLSKRVRPYLNSRMNQNELGIMSDELSIKTGKTTSDSGLNQNEQSIISDELSIKTGKTISE